MSAVRSRLIVLVVALATGLSACAINPVSGKTELSLVSPAE